MQPSSRNVSVNETSPWGHLCAQNTVTLPGLSLSCPHQEGRLAHGHVICDKSLLLQEKQVNELAFSSAGGDCWEQTPRCQAGTLQLSQDTKSQRWSRQDQPGGSSTAAAELAGVNPHQQATAGAVANSAQDPWWPRVFLNYLFGSTSDLLVLDYLIPLSYLPEHIIVSFLHLLTLLPSET